MSILLQVKNLKKEYSGQLIFSNLTFSITDKSKVGIVGVNGAGKSTLFRIISGEEKADQGDIIISDSAKISYLKQNDDFIENEKALDYLIRKSNSLTWKAKKIASFFEIDKFKIELPVNSFSGGWRLRLRLCAVLLEEPNLILLDEPSNYLDLNTLILLENYLTSYRASFLIISHDRYFLNNTCEEIIEIAKSSCYHYPGKIDSYLSFKEKKLEGMMKANKKLDKKQRHW